MAIPAQRQISRLCVFCGSNHGARAEYTDAARELGRMLAAEGVTLVYGGGRVGLMGVIADAVLAEGGSVIGVIPQALATKELAHDALTEMHVVDTMHERKALMADLADGFITMPGGYGSFEEFFETVTWAQLGIHEKPCGLLNVGGYYDHLIAHVDNAVEHGFVKPAYRDLIMVESEPKKILARIRAYQSPITERWVGGDKR